MLCRARLSAPLQRTTGNFPLAADPTIFGPKCCIFLRNMLEYYDNSLIGGAGYDLGRNDIHSGRGGLRGCGRDRHEGHSLRSVVPAAVRRESLRQIRCELQLSARLRHAGRDARAHSGAPPCPRAPDDLGDRGLQRQQGHQGREKRTQRRNAAPARPSAPRGRARLPRRGQRLRPVRDVRHRGTRALPLSGPVLFLHVGLLHLRAQARGAMQHGI